MHTVGQSNKSTTHSWLTCVKALMHVLFGLLVPPEKEVIEISGSAATPNWPKLMVQRLWSASRHSPATNKEQDLLGISSVETNESTRRSFCSRRCPSPALFVPDSNATGRRCISLGSAVDRRYKLQKPGLMLSPRTGPGNMTCDSDGEKNGH